MSSVSLQELFAVGPAPSDGGTRPPWRLRHRWGDSAERAGRDDRKLTSLGGIGTSKNWRGHKLLAGFRMFGGEFRVRFGK